MKNKSCLNNAIIGALIGAFVFVFMYGPKILDVTYTAWILDGWCDLRQHYLGWALYRNSGWNFPIGLCDCSFYPYYQSVVFTDSLPLVSLIFKILSPLLPKTFQFFGIYGLFCFAMQGAMADVILKRLLKKDWQCHVAVLTFVLNASLIQRMYLHTALASHYLILMGIALFVYRDKIKSFRLRLALWCLLGMACVSMHMALYGMVSVMLLGFAVVEGLYRLPDKRRAVFTGVLFVAVYIILSVFVLYLFGGFYGKIDGSSWGLGYYSANLNTLFDPDGYSRIIRTQPHNDGQYEGMAYIGITAIILLIVAIPNIKRRFKYLVASYKYEFAGVLITACLLWFVALSPTVTLGNWTLFEEYWPQWILDIWGIFRSSGRFVWPFAYGVMFMALYFSSEELKKSFSFVLILAVILQVYEYGDVIRERQEDFGKNREAYFSAMELENYDLTDKKHIQYMHLYDGGTFYGDQTYQDQVIGYADYAARHGMTVSNFYFSRENNELTEEYIKKCSDDLVNGNIKEDVLYVYDKRDFEESDLSNELTNAKFIYTDTEVIVYR